MRELDAPPFGHEVIKRVRVSPNPNPSPSPNPNPSPIPIPIPNPNPNEVIKRLFVLALDGGARHVALAEQVRLS